MNTTNRLWTTFTTVVTGVYGFDVLIDDIPRVLEGGAIVGGLAVGLIGVEGIRKALSAAWSDRPAAQEGQPASEPQLAPEATFPAPMTLQALPVASPREDLLRAYQMGAAAATSQQRIER
jgi:arginine exporter protein ArgO